MPPIPNAKDVPGPTHNYHLDQDLLAEDPGSDTDDGRTLADIVKGF